MARAGGSILLLAVVLWALDYLWLADGVFTAIAAVLAVLGLVMLLGGLVRRARR